ncbi:DUF3019 domain-containing protein [Glaciecola sp. SC05]|uniref:DUF3019 domain-containing protein n=1 Tax=Glaciecola sp. SC05 TaxID=1987355 RepID=UPI0035279C41
MFFKKRPLLLGDNLYLLKGSPLLVLAALLGLLSKPIMAKEPAYSLTTKPKECVSLYQGQTCYLTLDFDWSAPVSGDYCLFIKTNSRPMQCWSKESVGSFSQEFETDKDLTFELRSREASDIVLASTTLTLSWVYKVPNKKRLAWRLF